MRIWTISPLPETSRRRSPRRRWNFSPSIYNRMDALRYRLLTALVFAAFLSPACATSPTHRPDEPPLLNIKELTPGIVVDMRYASQDNFTGRTLYPAAE